MRCIWCKKDFQKKDLIIHTCRKCLESFNDPLMISGLYFLANSKGVLLNSENVDNLIFALKEYFL